MPYDRYRHVKKTIGSDKAIRMGVPKTFVTICLVLFFSISTCARTLRSPVRRRISCARFCSITGAYVSGKKAIGMRDTPAAITAIENVHRQLTEDAKPDTSGPNCGPIVTACVFIGFEAS